MGVRRRWRVRSPDRLACSPQLPERRAVPPNTIPFPIDRCYDRHGPLRRSTGWKSRSGAIDRTRNPNRCSAGSRTRGIARTNAPKVSVICQSAVAPAPPRPPRQDCLEVCVLSHLRDVKDPLLAANAARLLPDESRVRIVHAGRALNSDWEAAAREQERKNPRYEWVGDQPHDQAMYLLSGSRYLVLSSLMEGGASVIAEAVVCGVPVLCSRIPGNIGMLGLNYRGYFEPRDLGGLAEKLRFAEACPSMHEDLGGDIRALQPRFSPQQEHASWHQLLAAL